MESTRPIRALMRGLEALTVLNSRDGATVSEVAQEIRLPRTTVYRILETLCDAGFVLRDAVDDRYRLTPQVRGLCDGFEDESWVAQRAKPEIDALCADIGWPVALATLSDSTMMVRETTDHETPLAEERYSAGFRLPLLSSAAGRAYLAFCPAGERSILLEALARSNREADKAARSPRAELEQALEAIATEGFAMVTRTRRMADEISLAVPVLHAGRALAVLTVRFMSSALPIDAARERFLPKMRQTAAKIGISISESLAAARAHDAPETAA